MRKSGGWRCSNDLVKWDTTGVDRQCIMCDNVTILTIVHRVFLAKHLFRNGDKFTTAVAVAFAEQFPGVKVSNLNAVRELITKCRKIFFCKRHCITASP